MTTMRAPTSLPRAQRGIVLIEPGRQPRARSARILIRLGTEKRQYNGGGSTLDQDPASIGRFRIARRLGEGGMGVVYAGYDDALQREVAIKLLRVEGAARSSALLREARAAARVTHPSVRTIYEVREHEGTPFLVMELLDGESVAARLATAALGPFEACTVLVLALEALEALHREGLVHLDIKPANIFITSHGVKLLDFGLARAQSASDPTSTSRNDLDEALQIATDDGEDELRIIVLAAMNRHAEARELAGLMPPRLSGRDSTAAMRTLLRAFLEDRIVDAIAALHVASGVDPHNPHVWPRFPDGEDAQWMARFYTRLGQPQLGLLGFRAAIEQGYFPVAQFDADAWLDPIRSDAAFVDAMTLAHTRHRRAVRMFTDEGGPGLLGVDAPSA